MTRYQVLLTCGSLLFLAACGGKSETPSTTTTTSAGASGEAGGLSAFEQENGVGPVTKPVDVEEGEIEDDLAEPGKVTFDSKCSACHKFDERYVGPPLGDVTTRRTPAYIMNMVLNPEGMTQKHPAAKQLLGEYMTQMPNLGLTEEQARQVLEYLRSKAPQNTGK